MHMAQEARDKSSVDRNWRLTIYSLLALMAICTGLATQEFSAVPHQETSADRWLKSPLINAPPWKEIQRLPSPDGKIDAVLVKNEDDVLPLTALRLVPTEEAVVDEPPYRRLTIFLKRVCRESVFVGTNMSGVNLSWDGKSKLLVSGQNASFFSHKKMEEVSMKGEKARVEVSYTISDVRYLNKP